MFPENVRRNLPKGRRKSLKEERGQRKFAANVNQSFRKNSDTIFETINKIALISTHRDTIALASTSFEVKLLVSTLSTKIKTKCGREKKRCQQFQ